MDKSGTIATTKDFYVPNGMKSLGLILDGTLFAQHTMHAVKPLTPRQDEIDKEGRILFLGHPEGN